MLKDDGRGSAVNTTSHAGAVDSEDVQSMVVVPINGLYLPGAHKKQVASEVPQAVTEYFPPTQSKHAEEPGLAWNFPGSHGTQDVMNPRVIEYLPAEHSPEHVRLVAPSEVSVEYFPASQPIQALDPVILV
jgi:hypothetical protein